jgi:SAM-dependent methyltransferase
MINNNTSSDGYFKELQENTDVFWKKIVPIHLPYTINLKKQLKGKTLEVGCGLGRNLKHLQDGSVGVDHNKKSVMYCLSKGLPAMSTEDFHKTSLCEKSHFDNLLVSHVLEHIELDKQADLLREYIPYLKQESRIFIVTPQERGHELTDSHITWTDFDRIKDILIESAPDFEIRSSYSFPFPRMFGKWFNYNEFNVVAERI